MHTRRAHDVAQPNDQLGDVMRSLAGAFEQAAGLAGQLQSGDALSAALLPGM